MRTWRSLPADRCSTGPAAARTSSAPTRPWEESHLSGAVHIPLHELTERIGELPLTPVWVHCASGHRATIADSLLAGAGREVVVVDDEWDTAAGTGLPLIYNTDEEGAE